MASEQGAHMTWDQIKVANTTSRVEDQLGPERDSYNACNRISSAFRKFARGLSYSGASKTKYDGDIERMNMLIEPFNNQVVTDVLELTKVYNDETFKFPMPIISNYLLSYEVIEKNETRYQLTVAPGVDKNSVINAINVWRKLLEKMYKIILADDTTLERAKFVQIQEAVQEAIKEGVIRDETQGNKTRATEEDQEPSPSEGGGQDPNKKDRKNPASGVTRPYHSFARSSVRKFSSSLLISKRLFSSDAPGEDQQIIGSLYKTDHSPVQIEEDQIVNSYFRPNSNGEIMINHEQITRTGFMRITSDLSENRVPTKFAYSWLVPFNIQDQMPFLKHFTSILAAHFRNDRSNVIVCENSAQLTNIKRLFELYSSANTHSISNPKSLPALSKRGSSIWT